MNNPITGNDLLLCVQRLDDPHGLHHSIAITGGEPLLHVSFLREFLPVLKTNGYRVYLETAGHLVQAMKKIEENVDIVAMDIKLPSVTQDRERWAEHAAFLELCAGASFTLFTKSVVHADTDPAELERAAGLIKAVAPETPFIIQPMSSVGAAQNPATPSQPLDWQKRALRHIPHVRVIPQCHKMMGQL